MHPFPSFPLMHTTWSHTTWSHSTWIHIHVLVFLILLSSVVLTSDCVIVYIIIINFFTHTSLSFIVVRAQVHRIGRTGRAGCTGIADSLFTPGDRYVMHYYDCVLCSSTIN